MMVAAVAVPAMLEVTAVAPPAPVEVNVIAPPAVHATVAWTPAVESAVFMSARLVTAEKSTFVPLTVKTPAVPAAFTAEMSAKVAVVA